MGNWRVVFLGNSREGYRTCTSEFSVSRGEGAGVFILQLLSVTDWGPLGWGRGEHEFTETSVLLMAGPKWDLDSEKALRQSGACVGIWRPAALH